MNMKMQAIVNELKEDGHTRQEIMDALCDGEYLATINATQDEAEDAHDDISRLGESLV